MVYDINSIFFFKQKTAYEMRISDWSSDVCSSDLPSRSSAERGRFSKYALATIIGFQQGLDRCDMLDPQILRIGKSDHQFHRKAGEIKIAAQPAFCEIDPLGHDLLPALIIGIKRTEIVACPLQVDKVFGRTDLDIRDAECYFICKFEIGRGSWRARGCQAV